MSVRSSKPLPLKQRTSSVDTRQDFSIQTWTSLLGIVKPREYLVTVNNFSIWRRHLAWAMNDGADLRNYMVQRYASNMVFVSLLLGAELSVLFNPDPVASSIRSALQHERSGTVEFWIGMVILISIISAILSLISTFTAWSMVSAISDGNSHCILRSSIGQYVAELPGRFIVLAIYSFLLWVTLSVFVLLPIGVSSVFLVFGTLVLFFHVVVVFSAFGRIIMHTGAMGDPKIFDDKFEKSLLPLSLHGNLLTKAKAELANNTSITRQYRRKVKPLDRHYAQEDLSEHLRKNDEPTPPEAEPRKRADSTVRFADQLWSSAPPRADAATPLSDISNTSNVTPETNATAAKLFEGKAPKSKDDDAGRKSTSTTESSGIFENPDMAPAERSSSIRSLEEWLQAGSSFDSGGGTPTSAKKTIDAESEKRDVSGEMTFQPRFPPPVSTITTTTNREISGTSSIHDSFMEDDRQSSDDRFDREYGHLFDPESAITEEVPSKSERRRLLRWEDRNQGNNYSSTLEEPATPIQTNRTLSQPMPPPPPPPPRPARPPTPAALTKHHNRPSFSGSNV